MKRSGIVAGTVYQTRENCVAENKRNNLYALPVRD